MGIKHASLAVLHMHCLIHTESTCTVNKLYNDAIIYNDGIMAVLLSCTQLRLDAQIFLQLLISCTRKLSWVSSHTFDEPQYSAGLGHCIITQVMLC